MVSNHFLNYLNLYKGAIISTFNTKNQKPKQEHVVNEDIPYKKVFVIGPDNEKIGVLSKDEAIDQAKSYNMDLVLIALENNRPIARILDYGKFKYDKKKKQKAIKEKQSVTINREIRLTPLIGDHDLQTKARKAKEFILENSRVKVSVKFRGRELSRRDLGEDVLNRFFALVEDVAKISKEATLNNRFLDMYIEKDKKKVEALLKQENKAQGEDNAKDEN